MNQQNKNQSQLTWLFFSELSLQQQIIAEQSRSVTKLKSEVAGLQDRDDKLYRSHPEKRSKNFANTSVLVLNLKNV